MSGDQGQDFPGSVPVKAGSPEAERLAALSRTDQWEHGCIEYPDGAKWFTGGGSGGIYISAAPASHASFPDWRLNFDVIPSAYRGAHSASGPPPRMYDRQGNYAPPFNAAGEYDHSLDDTLRPVKRRFRFHR